MTAELVEMPADQEPVVAAEVAEKEFQRFVEAMDLTSDHRHHENQGALELAKSRVMHALQDGRLHINADGCPVFRPGHDQNQELTFPEPTGATLMAFDRVKENRNVEGSYSVLGDWTKTNAMRFSRMKMRDLKVCRALVELFIPG